MIINIITRSNSSNKKTRGPKKVLDNLIKGLEKLEIKYVFNQPISKFDYNWIHDDPAGVIEASFVNKPVLIGPNIAVFPKDLPFLRKKIHPSSIYLQPCDWAKRMWADLGFKEILINVWPVGIETSKFLPNKPDFKKTLIYFKQRDQALLIQVEDLLIKKNIDYEIIKYGEYNEDDFISILDNTSLVIWLGCTESQGIAYQEVLSKNIPIVFLDAINLFMNTKLDLSFSSGKDKKILERLNTSSAPYFDGTCGEKFVSTKQLEENLSQIIRNIDNYKPREFIMRNLSIEKQTLEFLSLVKKTYKKNNESINYKLISRYLYFMNLILFKIMSLIYTKFNNN